MRRVLPLVLALLVAVVAAAPADAAIVVNGRYKSFSNKTLTVTYTSSKGTFSARLIGTRHYRLRGTISGKKLRGTFRTRQTATKTSYTAKGSGTLGGRKIRISGGGPNNLKTSRLVLR